MKFYFIFTSICHGFTLSSFRHLNSQDALFIPGIFVDKTNSLSFSFASAAG
jgi:hypothetical protein